MVLLNNKKSKKGFSLLELLLVLGIIVALVVAAFYRLSQGSGLHKERRQNSITLPPYRQVLKRYTRRHQALLA